MFSASARRLFSWLLPTFYRKDGDEDTAKYFDQRLMQHAWIKEGFGPVHVF